ncbi:zinc finger, CCHC-type containing protein [Tanacetum coccineum]
MAEDASSKKFLVSNFNNYKMVDSRFIMEKFNKLLRILRQYTQHGLKMDESISVSNVIDKLPPSWKDFKHSLKHGKDDLSLVQLEEGRKNKNNKQNKGNKRGFKDNNGGSGFNKKPKLECWKCGKTSHFKRDCRSGNKKNNASASGSEKGSKDQSQDQDGSVLYMGDNHFTPVHGKGSVVLEFSSEKSITLFNVLYVPKLRFGYYDNRMFMLDLNKVPDDSGSIYMSSSTVVNSLLWHARLGHVHYKRMLEMSKDDLIPTIDENPGKSPYTPQQNGVAERKNRALKIMVNSIAIVRLPDPKRKTLGKKGIDCNFVGYVEHSKAYRFYVIEPNDNVSINSIIESRDAIFDENRFSSIPRPNDIIPNSNESQREDHSNDVQSETSEPHKEDPKTHNEAMQSRDAAFWKEEIDDEIGSIMENNTWVLPDLPPGCKPLGCKWIFKRKMKVDGTIEKFKARLVIQGFRQKEWIDYFNTYALVALITTIILLLALAAIHNLVIHQMDVKTTFLNGDLEEEVYMKQPKGFFMPGNEHKVCKLVKSLYGLKHAPKQWHQKFDEVVLSSSFLLNQSDKCIYNKFDSTGKGVIIWIDYFNTCALVALITTIILLLALAAIHNLVIHQMDVKTSFLNGDLEEEVYMKQPKGFFYAM